MIGHPQGVISEGFGPVGCRLQPLDYPFPCVGADVR